MPTLGIKEQSIQCPYCGECISILIDCSISHQEYIEDCQVCCCPITVLAEVQDDWVDVQVRHENEYPDPHLEGAKNEEALAV